MLAEWLTEAAPAALTATPARPPTPSTPAIPMEMAVIETEDSASTESTGVLVISESTTEARVVV